jgi:hypothetical protein
LYSFLLCSSSRFSLPPHLDIALPHWRKGVKRVGVGYLIKELKKELLLQFFAVENYKPPPKILKVLLKRQSKSFQWLFSKPFYARIDFYLKNRAASAAF